MGQVSNPMKRKTRKVGKQRLSQIRNTPFRSNFRWRRY
jgi:hypothetical protein